MIESKQNIGGEMTVHACIGSKRWKQLTKRKGSMEQEGETPNN